MSSRKRDFWIMDLTTGNYTNIGPLNRSQSDKVFLDWLDANAEQGHNYRLITMESCVISVERDPNRIREIEEQFGLTGPIGAEADDD